MFPYADKPDDYWTGYYSSRADKKEEDRIASSNLHASNKIFAEEIIKLSTSDETIDDILKSK